MSCEQECFAWSFQFWLAILFVCLGALSLHIMEPHLQWRDLNGMTQQSSFF